jgi:hypothetical protein
VTDGLWLKLLPFYTGAEEKNAPLFLFYFGLSKFYFGFEFYFGLLEFYFGFIVLFLD